MNFKLKMILLILSVSLIPYIFIMIYMGNTLQKTYYTQTEQEMLTQLKLSVDTIEQYLHTLQRDMLFMSQLDVMNDIYSKDVDRRISQLLTTKKEQLHLVGDFHVIDNQNLIIASSNPNKIFQSYSGKPFFTQQIYSSFDQKPVGKMVLDFSLQNISNLFKNSQDRHYYIIYNKKVLYKKESFKMKIDVRMPLVTKPNLIIVLEQNQEAFLSLLNRYKKWFIIAIIFGAFLISMIAFYFINRLIKPIITLSQVTEEITKKQDYSYQVDVKSNDEIGVLSDSFNKMIISMNQAMQQIRDDAKNKEHLIEERSKNEMLKELSNKLSRYLSPQIYQSIFEGKQDVTLTSKRKKLTIFFSDIVDFTATTESMESEDLSELLNDYLNEMTNIALRHGATIDKYIGDAMMLFFGDPYSKGIREDAIACVNMALEMLETMEILHQRWKKRGFTKPFKVRMGIHTGYCTVGNFGSKERLEYTIIGSSVNLASRIESAAGPNEILISEETKLLLDDRFAYKQSKELVPKGFKRSIALYSVFKKEEKATDARLINPLSESCLDEEKLQHLSQEEKERLKVTLTHLLQKL